MLIFFFFFLSLISVTKGWFHAKSTLLFAITFIWVLFNKTVSCYIDLSMFQVNSVVHCILGSLSSQLISYYCFNKKTLFYKGLVVLQSFASHLE